MADQEQVKMTIIFIDGSVLKFQFPHQSDEYTAGARMQEMLSENSLTVELEDRTLLIPLQNIRYLEVVPSPTKLAKNTIRNATLI